MARRDSVTAKYSADDVRRFNFRQASVTAREPTAMELAFREAGPPKEKCQPGVAGTSGGARDDHHEQGKPTATAAHLQRLQRLYRGGNGE